MAWKRIAVFVVLVLVLALAALYLFWCFWNENHEEIRTFVITLAAVFGFGFALWRTHIADKQAEAARKQADTAEQGHITDRYSRAVEQLGHDRVSVRIGGLSALKRIAEDSSGQDHLAVMDVLTNFISHTPYIKDQQESEAELAAWEAEKDEKIRETLPKPRLIDCPDVEMAIAIVRNHIDRQKAVEDSPGYEFSLVRAKMSFLRLPDADLMNANLTAADLMNADLTRARLAGADLTGANLPGANLTDANLRGVKFDGTALKGGKFGAVTFRMDHVNQIFSSFSMPANLTAADLTDADLTDAVLWEANLTCANLTYANLAHADLTDANLTGANLLGATLTGANLLGATLTGADLKGADLRTAKNLTRKQLEAACVFDVAYQPKLPDEFKDVKLGDCPEEE